MFHCLSVPVSLFYSADMHGLWGLLLRQLEALVRDTTDAFPYRSLCVFALCDLVLAMDNVLVPDRDTVSEESF